jgi:DNA-binding beta-propeller fold protein YncE
VKFDGADLWVASNSGQVTRVRASDGSVLGTWSGATTAVGLVCALGKVFIIGATTPGKLYMIDPTQAPGTVTTLAINLGDSPFGIAFDGTRLWTANISGSVSLVSLNPTTVTTVSTGFSQPIGALYDGSNIWVTDFGDETIKKLNSNGTILQTITLDTDPDVPVFDGINIWVPNQNSNSISVVRVKDPSGNALESAFVLATLTLNGLANPTTASFDGERILVTNNTGNSVSLWKAADLTPLGNFPTGAGTSPTGACSDGLNFWITLGNTGKLARF